MPLVLYVLDEDGEKTDTGGALFAPFADMLDKYLVLFNTENEPAEIFEVGDGAILGAGALVLTASSLNTSRTVELGDSTVLNCVVEEVEYVMRLENCAYPDGFELACPGCGQSMWMHELLGHCFKEHPPHQIRGTPFKSYTEFLQAVRDLLRDLSIDYDHLGWLEPCVEELQGRLDHARQGYEKALGN
jgi:hypothetical protein